MAATAEQLRIAASIDAKMQLLGARCDDATILAGMYEHMAGFKQLRDNLQ